MPLAARALAFCGILHTAVAQIKVISPKWLRRKVGFKMPDHDKEILDGWIEGSTATFGAPFYGAETLGQIIWVDPGDHIHCTDDDYELPEVDPPASGMSEKKPVPIVMVRRGKCSFTTKVRIAASKGAQAVIIVDKEDSDLTEEDIHNIIVADDGWGDQITVPSILVDKETGQKLIDATKKSSVLVELNWDVPDFHVVALDMWMSAGSKETSRFLKEFTPFRRALGNDVIFIPHFQVYSVNVQKEPSFANLCSDSEGSFCADDPDGSGDISGKDVLYEDVRQLCIHELTGASMINRERTAEMAREFDKLGLKMFTEYADQYWQYVQMLPDSCPLEKDPTDSKKVFGSECSYKLMRYIGIDETKVQKCEIESFDDKLKQQKDFRAWSNTAIRINGWRYAGAFDSFTVAKAICSGFHTMPRACHQMLEAGAITEPPAITVGGFLKVIGVIAVVIPFWLCMYRRYLTKQMHMQVREEVMLEVRSQLGSGTYAQMQC